MEGRVRCWLVNQWKPGQGEVGRGHLEGPNLPLHPQFSKDVLVNIYSAYIDNFLNAKDAVRVAKEARPAFLKFLEVPGPGRGMEATLLGSALGVSGAPSLDPRALACGSISPLRARGAHWGPVPGRFHLCWSYLTWVPINPISGFSKACVRTRRSRHCPTS